MHAYTFSPDSLFHVRLDTDNTADSASATAAGVFAPRSTVPAAARPMHHQEFALPVAADIEFGPVEGIADIAEPARNLVGVLDTAVLAGIEPLAGVD